MDKRSVLLAGVLLLLLSLVACAPVAAPTAAPAPTPTPLVAPTPTTPPPTAAPRYGGVLREGLSASLKAIDPVWTTATVTWNTSRHLWDTLAAWDSSYKSRPVLLESWKASDDLKTWTFTLRSGLTFHDGKPITTDDVIPSLRRWGARISTGMAYFRVVKDIERADERTFRIHFADPFGLAFDYIANEPFIMPKELATQPAVDRMKTDTFPGSGPFRFVSWREGDRVVLERYGGYKSRAETADGMAGARIAYVDRIEQMEVPDPATRVAAVEVGQLHVAFLIPNDFYGRLKGSPNVNLIQAPGGNLLVFNNAMLPFSHKKARQAVMAVTSPEEYLRMAHGDPELWKVCPAIFGCGFPWETKVGQEVYFGMNVEKGRRLWKEFATETGWDKPVIIMTNTEYRWHYLKAQVTLRDIQEKLGVPVDFQVTDWATLVTRRAKKEGWHIFHTTGAMATWYDPVQASHFSPKWFAHYDQPRLDELQRAFLVAKDDKERLKVVEEFQRVYYEELPMILLGESARLTVTHKGVKGFGPLNSSLLHLWNVWLAP